MKSDRLYNWIGKSILVVEDDRINYSYLDILLKPTKAKILHAEKGEEAIELCRKTTLINIVLMDIRLPGINGLETTKEIHAIRNDLPVIAQTAYATDADKKAALAAGCCAFIAKPIRANEMLDMIKKYLN